MPYLHQFIFRRADLRSVVFFFHDRFNCALQGGSHRLDSHSSGSGRLVNCLRYNKRNMDKPAADMRIPFADHIEQIIHYSVAYIASGRIRYACRDF